MPSFESSLVSVDLATSVVEFAVNWFLQSTLLISAGLAIGAFLRRRGSAVQSVVYRTTLAAVLICPLATWGLSLLGVSGWSVKLPAGWAFVPAMAEVGAEQTPIGGPEQHVAGPALPAFSESPVEFGSGGRVPGSPPNFMNAEQLTVPATPVIEEQQRATPLDALAAGELPAGVPTVGPSVYVPAVQMIGVLALVLGTIWLVVTVGLAIRLAIAWRGIRRLRCRAVRADDLTLEVCRQLANQLEVHTPPVLRSPYLPSPCLAGVRRPTILLPEVEQSLRLRDVLVHELAHLKRHDCNWNLLRRLATAAFFFQPLLWKLSSLLESTAEEVCDDYVVAFGGDRQEYAYQLVEIAELSTTPMAVAGVGIVSLRSMLAQRVTRILDTSRVLSTRVGNLLLLAVLLGGLVGTGIVGLVGIDPKKSLADVETAAAKEEDQSELDRSANDGGQGDTISIHGKVVDPDEKPIVGAKIWLAVASHQYPLVANRDNRTGLLRELGTTDEQGRFEVVLDAVTTQEIRQRFSYLQTQLVATAPGHGLDWMPLDVFEVNSAPSENRDALQAKIDKALGDGHFASRTLKLRPESQPVRGRLVDLEGNRLPKVTVSVERLIQPDVPRLLKAFEMSWKREMNEAFSATGFGVGGLARSELQKLIPPVTTDENGEFELRGIGDDQLVTLVFAADRVEARPLYVLGREMETVSLPHIEYYLGGAKDVFVGRDFTYALGPSVPVEGVVTDYDTGEPIAGVLVYVERLFKGDRDENSQLRLDTHHMQSVTDRQGRFRITGMPPGEGHVLEVVPPKSEPYLPVSQDVSLSLEDGDSKRIEFRVKRGIWIEGRVTDKQSGEPLLATVGYLALKENPHSLDKLGLDLAWDEYRYGTDSDGRYRVLGLPGPGVLLVKSQSPQSYPLEAGAETIDGYDASDGRIPTAPGPMRVSDWHLLKQIDPAADVGSFACDLELDAGDSIPGRVVGPDGKPTSNLSVLGQNEGDEWWRPRHNDNFRLTDRFEVYGYDGKGPRQLFFKSQDETLIGQYRLEGDAPKEIVVTLQPSVRVTGRVIDSATDLPAARCFVSCEKCFLSNEKYPPVNFRTPWCFTDDEGRFEIKGLMAGHAYEMVARSDIPNSNDHRFTIDLTAAKPGDVIELGEVTGLDSEGDFKN